MKKIKVMTIFGTRPEAIKMAPIILELEKQFEIFESVVVVTAQHRQMLDQVLNIFNIKPNYDLNIMKNKQSLAYITSNVLIGLEKIIKKEVPDIILVHGDTTTTFAASLAAFYNQIKIGHVEAGLRTWNKFSPYPEEMNRQVTDVLADLYFAPTIESKANLLKENHPEEHIFITGNTAIDALKETVQEHYHHELLDKLNENNKLILMTMHRRENIGEPMRRVFKAVREVVESHEDVEVAFPVHLNPVVQEIAKNILGGHERIHLIEPLDVIDFHNIAARSYMIMSDSGGVQEEAPSLGVPVLVLRDTTERPEGVVAGTLELVGTETVDVLTSMNELLENEEKHNKMTEALNPYGDGSAAKRILEAVKYEFGVTRERPPSF
ncbi:non-hydrolyzing UDP-N-acetylglucosamine 2-epimerase [Carnobacterium inhibens]|uniref:UDP-N-acetylglucosamine 2-epimerase (non-hydrolyzing) n=1 Tax=Carnobacterium inhibens TaxID=147709 RepID=A0ABR7TD39_9LACT|nr:UDP-N-acetylglucosamine 2-epimerase (non-hydrolyzing) [Carnobacterium inhibens]MBC9825905.1 UDP-N-acetylglucosamine 2-epimerase (non-hydrolyzing) [Carnobacterium inhibens]